MEVLVDEMRAYLLEAEVSQRGGCGYNCIGGGTQ